MADADFDDAPTRKPLAQIERDDCNKDPDEDIKRSRDIEKNFWTRVAQGAALASGILAIAAVVLSSVKSVTIVAGLIAIGVAGLVIYQQELLQDTDTLRKVQNELRKEVNRLQIENNKLVAEVDKIEGTISQLKGSETKLESIAQSQGSNVSSLVSLVKENGAIQKQMMDITKAETLQRLFEAILQSDRDANFKITEAEVQELVIRLKVDPRVEVNQGTLESRLASAGGELSIRDLTEELMKAGQESNGERIFFFSPEKVS